MANWGEGYITDIGYTSNFQRETAPAWLRAVAALLGFDAPPPGRPYAYAELGCGQGFNTALLAAANPEGRFHGFDFNPAHIAGARRLAGAGGLANAEFHEASFQELAAAPGGAWPAFDFVVLHGVYSWVSRANQLALVEFIRRFLKPGGLAYLSYNCSAGWAAMVPAKRLMRLHADRHPGRSDLQGQAALAFLRQLQEAGAGYFQTHPGVAARLETAARQPGAYLAHEYLNRDWNPADLAQVCEDCAPAKLSHLGSAAPLDNLERLCAPPTLLAALHAEPDPLLRQCALDLALGRAFRRDIFQKGTARLTPQEHRTALAQIRLLPAAPAPAGAVKFATPQGEAEGRAELYGPLLAALAESEAGLTLADIAARPEAAGLGMDDLVELALLLMDAGLAHPAAGPGGGAAAAGFNRAVCQAALDGHDHAFLAAPAIGSGVAASFPELLAARLLAETPGLDAAAFAEAAWQLLERHGQSLFKGGAPLGEEAAKAELRAVHADFQAGKAALWRRLGVLP